MEKNIYKFLMIWSLVSYFIVAFALSGGTVSFALGYAAVIWHTFVFSYSGKKLGYL